MPCAKLKMPGQQVQFCFGLVSEHNSCYGFVHYFCTSGLRMSAGWKWFIHVCVSQDPLPNEDIDINEGE